MIKLEMTLDEANALATLIDMAVKAGGIKVAGAAAALMQKLEDAAKDVPPVQKEDE